MRSSAPPTLSRVLLIEDDCVFGRSTMRALSDRGVFVTWVESCAEARALASKRAVPSFDYVLVDDQLGDGFGLEILPLFEAFRPPPRIALLSAHPSSDRALAALRAHRALLPKPRTPSEWMELLAILDDSETPVEQPSQGISEQVFGGFRLEQRGLHTPTGFLPLGRASTAMLRFLLSQTGDFLTAAEVAREFFRRNDEAGQALVRRQIANLRRSLDCYAWVVASLPKRGYRIDPRAFDPAAGNAAP